MQKQCFILLLALTAVVVCWEDQVRPCNVECKDCPCLTCPDNTKPGYSVDCQCCKSCVIPKGGECPWKGDEPDSGDVECEIGTKCCNGICSDEVCQTTESTTEPCETTTDWSTTKDWE